MAEYRLTEKAEPCTVIRTVDNACIPPDPANRDYAEYTKWREDGGVPDPVTVPINPTLDSQLAKTTAQILGVF